MKYLFMIGYADGCIKNLVPFSLLIKMRTHINSTQHIPGDHNLNLHQHKTSNLTQSTSIFYANSNGQSKFLYLPMVYMKVTNCKTISEEAN